MTEKLKKMIEDFVKIDDEFKRKKLITIVSGMTNATRNNKVLNELLTVLKENYTLPTDFLVDVYRDIMGFGDKVQIHRRQKQIKKKSIGIDEIKKLEYNSKNNENELDNILNNL